ncbi:MAG: glycolate oxidase subunit GlcF [Kiloniellales bacterium]
MQTNFTLAQLADPDVRESEKILRTCVHCGFCTATCPTYVLLGDELDSPRGRIYLIKEMLEGGRAADEKTVKHIDRCLSCLSCMSTCPSGVHYMHLVDHARTHIRKTYRRPAADAWLRRLLAWMLPHPGRFRLALIGARLAKPLRGLVPAGLLGGRARAMLALAPDRIPSPSSWDRPQTFPAEGPRRHRMALMTGCAQQVLSPEINEATIRLLTRHGVEVVVAKGMGCCGALTHHMGEEASALASAKRNVAAWTRELDAGGLDAIVINASGCGTTVKDYGFMLREDKDWADRAQRVAGLAKDISEVLSEIGLKAPLPGRVGLTLAYHSACSLQHGQQVKEPPKALLRQAGFEVREVAEGHLCCGSAGTYNLLQPKIATQLRDRKVANIEATGAKAIATGNIGCMTQIATGSALPILHSVAYLDWATGGPLPKALEGIVEHSETASPQEQEEAVA